MFASCGAGLKPLKRVGTVLFLVEFPKCLEEPVMKKSIDRFLYMMDFINGRLGKILTVIIPIIVLIVVFEVISRYIFNAPTIWAWDVNMLLFAMTVFLGGGFVLKENKHISVDIVYDKWSPRKKAIADLITSPLFFFFIGILLWQMCKMTMDSVAEREVLSTVFAPPVYPIKILITIGIFLVALQGVAKFIRDFRTVFGKENRERG